MCNCIENRLHRLLSRSYSLPAVEGIGPLARALPSLSLARLCTDTGHVPRGKDVRGRSYRRRGHPRPRPRLHAPSVRADIHVARSVGPRRARRSQGLAPERAGPQEDEQGQDLEEEPGVHRAGQREGRADRGHAQGDRGDSRQRRRGRRPNPERRKTRRDELRGQAQGCEGGGSREARGDGDNRGAPQAHGRDAHRQNTRHALLHLRGKAVGDHVRASRQRGDARRRTQRLRQDRRRPPLPRPPRRVHPIRLCVQHQRLAEPEARRAITGGAGAGQEASHRVRRSAGVVAGGRGQAQGRRGVLRRPRGLHRRHPAAHEATRDPAQRGERG